MVYYPQNTFSQHDADIPTVGLVGLIYIGRALVDRLPDGRDTVRLLTTLVSALTFFSQTNAASYVFHFYPKNISCVYVIVTSINSSPSLLVPWFSSASLLLSTDTCKPVPVTPSGLIQSLLVQQVNTFELSIISQGLNIDMPINAA